MGVIHRDIKAENIMMDKNNQIKLLDTIKLDTLPKVVKHYFVKQKKGLGK